MRNRDCLLSRSFTLVNWGRNPAFPQRYNSLLLLLSFVSKGTRLSTFYFFIPHYKRYILFILILPCLILFLLSDFYLLILLAIKTIVKSFCASLKYLYNLFLNFIFIFYFSYRVIIFNLIRIYFITSICRFFPMVFFR